VAVDTQEFHSGIELETGDKLRGKSYDLVIDERPDQLYQEFMDEYGFDQDTVLEDATEFVDEEIKHIYEIADEKGLDPGELDRERREIQGDISEVRLSDVWTREYRGLNTGICRERAATLHLLLDELGIDSDYHSGYQSERSDEGHSWVQTDFNTVLDPSADKYVFERGRADLKPGKVVVHSGSTRDVFGQVVS